MSTMIDASNIDKPAFRRSLMTRAMTSPWLLILVVALSFFWQLGAVPLYDLDEGAFTEATREMLETGNFITPRKDGEPRYDKPVLIYWLQAASTEAFGFAATLFGDARDGSLSASNEFALRFPSAVAATLWVLALWGFVRARLDAPTATVAGLVMVLSLQVSLIAKAAVADAVLNLFIALTFFEIYRYFLDPDPTTNRRFILRAYLWMGLGFLTKGPVAVFFPVLVSLLFFLSEIRWSKASLFVALRWFRAAFSPLGWLIFLLVAGPWYLAIYLDDGPGFFQSFFLEHNAGRFGGAMHGHAGFPGYYLVMLPLILLPFSGWFLSLFKASQTAWSDPLERFLWIWFLTVFVFFSFSGTKLPHYLLYGAVPLFILMARYRDRLTNRWLAFGPPLLLMVALVALPPLLDVVIHVTDGIATSASAEVRAMLELKPHETALLADGRRALDLPYGIAVLTGLAALILLLRWSRPPLWQRLVLAGMVQAWVVYGFLVPRLFEAMQAPVREAGLLARRLDLPTVVYRTSLPSFSVYRDAITPKRPPVTGDLVFLRVDKLDLLERDYPELQQETLYRRGAVALLRMR
jgi:4-amino-4-deoxy-L-arabinose transferase-like glycosyltransferase